MSDQVFWDQLGLRRGAARQEIRRAYHRLAREHHPDIFPEEQKALQELKMIALNEAYSYLMRRGRSAGPGRDPGDPLRTGGAEADWPGRPVRTSTSGPSEGGEAPPNSAAADRLVPHRDPSYATYKQGFVHYSRALQGIEALYRSMSGSEAEPLARLAVGASALRPAVIHFKPRDDAYQRFAAGLSELRQAHDYFSRVVQDYARSIWRRDAEVKLGRIERFSLLYRRILGNLGSRR